MTTGLFPGRFQPFHKAHLTDIKNALKEVDSLIILIGSAQYANTPENPFSAEERKKMVADVLKAEKIRNCKIFALKDINDDSGWVDYVKNNLPRFDIVYSGNLRVINLFREKNVPVKKIRLIKNISGTIIREIILHKKEWTEKVPAKVAVAIRKIAGEKRIRESLKRSQLPFK